MTSMISSSVIWATRPRAFSSSYSFIVHTSCSSDLGQKKNALRQRELAEGEEIRGTTSVCCPLTGDSLTSAAPSVDGSTLCVCNARTRRGLLGRLARFSLQLRDVFHLLLCTPLSPAGASLGRAVQGTRFPSTPLRLSIIQDQPGNVKG